jgi:hypothetical protein
MPVVNLVSIDNLAVELRRSWKKIDHPSPTYYKVQAILSLPPFLYVDTGTCHDRPCGAPLPLSFLDGSFLHKLTSDKNASAS